MKRRISIFIYKIYLYFKEDFMYDLKDFLNYFNIVNKFSFLKRRFENLKYFFPIIWKDYWFDYIYLYILIRAKLIQMESKFRSSGMTESAVSCADEMKVVIDDLTRLIDNDIEAEEYHTYYEKYPKNKIKKFKHWIRNINRDIIHKSEEEVLYYKEMITRIEAREKELRLKVFNTIAINSPNWWD